MGTCFVIQPFDQGGPFDKRYDGVIAPAIEDAGLEPYRVDRDSSVSMCWFSGNGTIVKSN